MSYQTAAVKITAANTSRDATGSNVYELLHARQNCYVERLIFQPLGANAATAGRVFVNLAEPIDLASNNYLHREVTLPSTAASETAAVTAVELPLDIYLRAGQRLLLTIGTAPTDGFDAFAVLAPSYRDFNV